MCPYFENWFSKSHAWLPFKDRTCQLTFQIEKQDLQEFWYQLDILTVQEIAFLTNFEILMESQNKKWPSVIYLWKQLKSSIVIITLH